MVLGMVSLTQTSHFDTGDEIAQANPDRHGQEDPQSQVAVKGKEAFSGRTSMASPPPIV